MDAVASTTTRWCLGLRSLGYRVLRPDEEGLLRARLRGEQRKLGLPVALAAAAPLSLYLSFLLHGNGPEPPLPRLLVVCALAFAALVFPAASVLLCRDRLRNWRALRRDLRVGCVEYFEDIDSREPALSLGADENLPLQSLDVLPFSGTVLTLNGGAPPRRLAVDVYESAAPPDSAPCYALPSEVAAALPEEMLLEAEIDRRRLNQSELAEIDRHTSAARRPSWILLGFLAWTALGLVSARWSIDAGEGAAWARRHGPLFSFTAIFAFLHVVRYMRLWRAAQRLSLDREDGWVLVAREKHPDARAAEFLPRSRLSWSIDGDPAGWRLAKVGAREENLPTLAAHTQA